MQRQIKFRAKSLKNNEWIEGFYVHDVEWAKNYIYRQELRGAFYMAVGNEVDGNTVGQFTGMEDKSGKEIFEGDILRVRHQKHAEPDLYLTQEVYYNDGCFCLKVNHEVRPIQESLGNVPMFWINHPSFFEVLGNVFDNPELFKSCN